MTNTRIRSAVLLCITGSSLGVLPGCLVQDIHDEMVTTNERLVDIDGALDEVARVNERLATIDAKLQEIESDLTRVEGHLAKVEPSLSSTNEHLASLRQTISNIDSTIPFLSISGDEEDAEADEGESPPEGAPPSGDVTGTPGDE